MVKEKIKEFLKTNKWLILGIISAILVLGDISLNVYSILSRNKDNGAEYFNSLKQIRDENQEIYKQIKLSLDSIHIENSYLLQNIDKTSKSIVYIEQKRNDKIKYINSSPLDSTVKFLSNRYNYVQIP